MSHEWRDVDVRGYTVRVATGGSGPALVLFHGAGGAAEWSEFHARLAQRFTVYAPVQPGFAGSPLPSWLKSAEDVALHNFDVMAALEIERPHVLGISMGGWVATEMAIFRSAAMASLTLAGAVGVRPEQPMPDLFIMEPQEAMSLLFANPERALAARAGQPMDIDAIVTAWSDQAAVARLMWKRPYHPNLRRRLHHVTVPTLVVWGERDGLLPPAHGEMVAAGIPNARFEVVTDAGHVIHAEQPDRFAELVENFIEAQGAL